MHSKKIGALAPQKRNVIPTTSYAEQAQLKTDMMTLPLKKKEIVKVVL